MSNMKLADTEQVAITVDLAMRFLLEQGVELSLILSTMHATAIAMMAEARDPAFAAAVCEDAAARLHQIDSMSEAEREFAVAAARGRA